MVPDQDSHMSELKEIREDFSKQFSKSIGEGSTLCYSDLDKTYLYFLLLATIDNFKGQESVMFVNIQPQSFLKLFEKCMLDDIVSKSIKTGNSKFTIYIPSQYIAYDKNEDQKASLRSYDQLYQSLTTHYNDAEKKIFIKKYQPFTFKNRLPFYDKEILRLFQSDSVALSTVITNGVPNIYKAYVFGRSIFEFNLGKLLVDEIEHKYLEPEVNV